MLKMFGAVLVATGAMIVGLFAGQGLRRDVSRMRRLCLALELMGNEMKLDLPPLRELFEQVGRQVDGEVGELFAGTAVKLSAVSGRPPQTAIKMQLQEMEGTFSREEKQLLLSLCQSLGRYDPEGQQRILEVFLTRINTMVTKGESEMQNKSRAWMTASVCCGLAVVVILL